MLRGLVESCHRPSVQLSRRFSIGKHQMPANVYKKFTDPRHVLALRIRPCNGLKRLITRKRDSRLPAGQKPLNYPIWSVAQLTTSQRCMTCSDRRRSNDKWHFGIWVKLLSSMNFNRIFCFTGTCITDAAPLVPGNFFTIGRGFGQEWAFWDRVNMPHSAGTNLPKTPNSFLTRIDCYLGVEFFRN